MGTNKELSPWQAPKSRKRPSAEPQDPNNGGDSRRIAIGVLSAGVAFAAFAFAPGIDAGSADDSSQVVAAAVGPSTTAAVTTTTTVVSTTKPATSSSTTASTTTAPPTTVAETTTTTEPPATTESTTTRPRPTTTTTTVPTTTAPPTTAPRVLSVRDISTSKLNQGASWVAVATVTVQDQTGSVVPGASVNGAWSVAGQTSACTTDSSGKCSLYLYGIDISVNSVVLTMIDPSGGMTRTISRV